MHTLVGDVRANELHEGNNIHTHVDKLPDHPVIAQDRVKLLPRDSASSVNIACLHQCHQLALENRGCVLLRGLLRDIVDHVDEHPCHHFQDCHVCEQQEGQVEDPILP